MKQGPQNDHTAVVEVLLGRGSIIDTADTSFGMTALHLACMKAHENVVRLLLTAGASVTLEDNHGRSAMDWASEERHTAVRQILQQHIEAAPQPQPPQDSPSVAAGQAEEGTRRGSKRAFRFRCNNPACGNTEESEQRFLDKCGRCRGVRYCSDACRLVDWRAHKVVCRAPSLPDAAGSSSGEARALGPAASAESGAWDGAGGGAGSKRCGFAGCPQGDVKAREVCAACEKVRYCSRSCQLQHWPDHKAACKAARGAGAGASLDR